MQNIIVGKYTYGLENINLYWEDVNRLYIGAFCSIGKNMKVYLGNGVSHHIDYITTFPFGQIHKGIFGNIKPERHIISKGDVHIGNDVWIGDNVTIMSGVRVGDGAVIAANSHVVKDIEPYSISGGNPSTFIKFRFSNVVIDKLLKLQWWNWNDEVINANLPILFSLPENLDRLHYG